MIYIDGYASRCADLVRRDSVPIIKKAHSLQIRKDVPHDGGGESKGRAAPVVAVAGDDDDDDDGGDSDGEPARRRLSNNQILPALISYRDVSTFVGLGRSRLCQLVAENKFPQPLKIGKSCRFKTSEINAWIDSLVAARTTGGV